MNSVRVKICGITRLPDLQAALAAGADALGFVFAERSMRQLDPVQAEKLVREVPAFVSRVGLFMDQEIEDVERILEQVPLSLLQFHGSENSGYCRRFGLPYIKAVPMDSRRALERAGEDFQDAAALLLDSHQPGELGGTGKVFDWSMIPRVPQALVLAGGLTPENVRQAIRQVRPWAVDVSSGVEESPGIKSTEKLKKFIKEAKSEY